MIILKYTTYNKETKEPVYSYEVVEDEEKKYKDVLAEVEKKYSTESTNRRRVEVIEVGFVINKTTIHPRKITE